MPSHACCKRLSQQTKFLKRGFALTVSHAFTAFSQLSVGLLVAVGPEDATGAAVLTKTSPTTKAGAPALGPGSCNISPTAAELQTTIKQQSNPSSATGVNGTMRMLRRRRSCTLLAFIAWTAVWGVALVAVSDVAVRHHPGHGCLKPAALWLWGKLHGHHPVPHLSHASPGNGGGNADDMPGHKCWALQAYRLQVLIEDQTPNIGQLWYLFTELFPNYLAFFRYVGGGLCSYMHCVSTTLLLGYMCVLNGCRFVAHSLGAAFVFPLALRFPKRPLLLITAQAIIICMVKPYPSVADHALYMALLTLLQKQLSKIKIGMLLGNSFLLLAVLAPSMWHQWIDIESANSNFFYSITLIMGAWQTVLLVQLLLLTADIERLEAGKV